MKLIPRESAAKKLAGAPAGIVIIAADGLSGIGRNPPRRYLFIISASAPPGPLVNLTQRAKPSRATARRNKVARF